VSKVKLQQPATVATPGPAAQSSIQDTHEEPVGEYKVKGLLLKKEESHLRVHEQVVHLDLTDGETVGEYKVKLILLQKEH